MIQGIAIMGLNGCGKSTLAHALAKKTGYFEMDAEDYYFPGQRQSRRLALEGCAGGKAENPFSDPEPKDTVERAMIQDIRVHPRFVIAGVTMNWRTEICEKIDIAFVLQASKDVRMKRIQRREELRFGQRVLPGGDMFAQQEQFRQMAEKRDPGMSLESAKKLGCPVVVLDAELPVKENLRMIVEILRKDQYKYLPPID